MMEGHINAHSKLGFDGESMDKEDEFEVQMEEEPKGPEG